MEYEEIKPLKQSERSTVQLVREKNGEQLFVRKVLKGCHPIYEVLQNCIHPGLPKLYEVHGSHDFTTIIEEYIEGQALNSAELSKKQFLSIVRELCSVLEFLHEKGIIHRDIKPSNIILATNGHIYLIDFDAARMPKDYSEQDTRLLGTRGYAPPEQYGFDQTDVRADIYALGVTLKQLFGDKIHRPRYKRIIRKCMRLDPDKRFQSVRQVKKAFFHMKRSILCGVIVLVLAIFLWNCIQNSVIVRRMITSGTYKEEQILFKDSPVSGYLGRQIDDIMDEMVGSYDFYEDWYGSRCDYDGISFLLDYENEVYQIELDTSQSTINGTFLNMNREQLIAFLGQPTSEEWGYRNTGVVYKIYYDNFNEDISICFAMTSPGVRADTISIWSNVSAVYNVPDTDTTSGGEAAYQSLRETASDMEYKAAYAKKVRELAGGDTTTQFALINLRDSDIPELVVEQQLEINVFTWAEGELITLIDQWSYGGGENKGYEYLPGKNVIRNFNSDYDGAILYEDYMMVDNNYQLISVLDEALSIRYIKDANGNGLIDDSDEYSEEPSYYYGDTEISETEYKAYQISGNYELINGNASVEQIFSLIDGIDKVYDYSSADNLAEFKQPIENYYKLSGAYGGRIDQSTLRLNIYSGPGEEEIAIGNAEIHVKMGRYYFGEIIPVENNIYKVMVETEEEILLAESEMDGVIIMRLYVDGQYVDEYWMQEHYVS